jgi:outer membrane protein TolC
VGSPVFRFAAARLNEHPFEPSLLSGIDDAEPIESLAQHTTPLPLEPTALPLDPDDQGLTDSGMLESGIPITAVPLVPTDAAPLMLDFATALAMVGGNHPVVGYAQNRVREAYADLSLAKVLWLPSIRAGVSYHRHDGNLQASDGAINDVDRNSLQAGLGVGAVGAGTTPRHGVIAEFHVSDAIFQPRIAKRTAWASRHGQTAAYNQQLLDVAIAYNASLATQQELQVLEESRQRSQELTRVTVNYAEAGHGLQADADRMATELSLVESRLIEAREREAVARHRLAETISLDRCSDIMLTDPLLVPIEMVAVAEPGQMISCGLTNRPEVKELQCLVAAAVEEYKRQKYAPLVPSVLMGYSTSGFGGGLNSRVNDFDQRNDFDVLAVWEVRNLGFGERAARSKAASKSHQTKYQQFQLMDRVAREIKDAQAQISYRTQRIDVLERAVTTATDSNDRNLSRIRDGQGLPLEALQSMRALEDAQVAYVRAIAQHNESQFQLHWALGWPISNLAQPK